MALINTFIRVLILNAIDSAIKTFGEDVEIEIIVHKADDERVARLTSESMLTQNHGKHKVIVYSKSHLPF